MRNTLHFIKNHVTHAVLTWPSVIALGVFTSMLSAFSILLSFVAPNIGGNTFFTSFPDYLKIVIAIIFILCFVFAHLRPIDGGMMTCFVVCGLQIINSSIRGEPIQIVFWILFALACVWSVILKHRIYKYEQKYNELIVGFIERNMKDKI